ncbi:MAG: ABC transporter ATP-binding protein [Pseudomonadales bacterium]
MNAIDITQLSKHYGELPVLTDIELSVAIGEYMGLIGANGAGKTTLIKSLLDFTNANTGQMRIFGHTHNTLAAKAQLSFLPEKYQPPYFQSGRQFLHSFCRLHQVDFDEHQAKHTLQELDFDIQHLDKTARQYSKGMVQKIGLTACILSQKPLLILDEPMSGLDPLARARFRDVLVQQKAAGRSLFFSSHMLSDVEQLCDRIAILDQGRLRFVGTPSVCKYKYQANTLENAYLNCIGRTRAA